MLNLTESLAMALDPVRMARAIGYKLDIWQQKLCRSIHPRILINVSRQAGKSFCVALISVHQALYTPDSLVLMVSPSLRQSSELFHTALDVYRRLDKPVAPEIENRLSLELENGSRILSLPGKEGTVRGLAGAKLICCDEASRVPDVMLAAIRPMLATSGGRLIAPSTPAGRRGWWWQAWEQGGDTWERYRVTADQCPRISKEFLAEERRALGPSWFAAEYMTEFTNVEGSIFPEAYLQRIITEEEHAWTIAPAAWNQPQESQSLWQIKPVPAGPQMTEYGIPAFP